MAENKKLIRSINVTSTDISCPGCGATNIQFDPATTTLSCPFCGQSSPLPTPQTGAIANELDFNSALQRANVEWGKTKKLIVCSNCGGESLYDSEQVTGFCPFCGSSSVTPAADTNQIMEPNAVIPFSVSRDQLQDLFINFLHKKSLVNKKVFNCKLEQIVGIYLPFWTYDTFTASYYNAIRYNGVGNNLDEVNGDWYENIDDVLIFASDRVRHPFIKNILDYDCATAVPYSAEYLAGIPAERYTLGLNSGWEQAKNKIKEKLKKDVHRYNRNLRVTDIETFYYNVKFRCLLAPMYLAKYRYGKDTFLVAINGQTGKTYCDAPTILKKIIGLTVLGVFVASAIEVAAILLYAMYFR
ncbi:MAG: hypothetical protein J6U54_23830 [Clostridiales bacterium]|nr:hypothetical protein [Clostridiales bacterium]